MTQSIYSFTITKEQKNILLQHKQIQPIPTNNQYIECIFQLNDSIITIYNTQKCVIQGKNITDIKLLLNLSTEHNYHPINYSKKIIGCDEVGVGDYFGGLVVCAAYLDNSLIDKVLSLGVQDSKKLTDKQINEIAPKLIKIIPYQITEIMPIKYNQLYNLYFNSHIIKTIMHQSTLNKFTQNLNSKKIKVDKIILDQYASQDKYNDYLNKTQVTNNLTVPIEFVIHSEQSYVCVACASIIARYYFLKQIKSLSDKYNIEIPLGSWNNNIENTCKKIMAQFYKTNSLETVFQNLVKLHFSNTKKIKLNE